MNSLSRFTNDELEFRLKDLVQKERKLLHVILEHIREIDSRKLYLEKAYPSIFEYLTKELGYSAAAAMRRLEAARLLRDVPEVAERIQEGSLNLSQIGEISRAIKEKEKVSGNRITPMQKHELVSVVSGKTTQETQHELSQILDLPLKEFETKKVQKDESVRLELTLSKEQFEKLISCKDLAAPILLQGNGGVSLSEVIEFLADSYLDEKFKKVTKFQSNSTQSRNSKIKNTSLKPKIEILNTNRGSIITSDAEVENKSVTPKTRREVLVRDKCCQYIDLKTGNQCRTTFALQVDHKTSKWASGRNTLGNLQILCAQHNRSKYRREAGLSFHS
ncbi:HNH endonuclease [Bdellovibrio reynosensis]|uniref:HNH endonuclease n=1 Tax=Bdellovibrio reynosensis TaxID=2835041 RepID=A0ABY4C8T9_9BACT|nr:HNH endonuclease signature motif containing protein [Bdellovibrio reynosensis]UOF00884.1 HNH endonuclease [Bdellovibrio reynosensis]